MMIPISGQMSKVTSAIWGPYGEYIVTGHENGDLCQFDVKVCLVYFFLYGVWLLKIFRIWLYLL